MQFIDNKVKGATRKACNSLVAPPKPKHIRTIIMKSYNGGIPTFYSEIAKILQSSNMIHQYKALDVLNRVMLEGSNHLIKSYLDVMITLFNKLVTQPQQIVKNVSFQNINKHYIRYMHLRFIFHQKNKIFNVNLTLPEKQELPEEYYSDQKCLTIISYIMDLMDYLLVLPYPLLKNYPHDICKLDCCIPLILDSFVLYNDIIFFMTNLAHIDQHKSVFIFLYERLKKIYGKLEELYKKARENQYLSSMMDIPFLSPLPEFKVTEEDKQRYFKQHPHALTKKHQKTSKNIYDLDKLQLRDEKLRKNLVSLGSEFVKNSEKLLQLIISDETLFDEDEYQFKQMIDTFDESLFSMELNEIKMKVWNIIMNSTSLLNEQNIEYILLMKTKEDVINTLYTQQSIVNTITTFFNQDQQKMNEFNQFNKEVEEFINQLLTYELTTSNDIYQINEEEDYEDKENDEYNDEYEYERKDDENDEEEKKQSLFDLLGLSYQQLPQQTIMNPFDLLTETTLHTITPEELTLEEIDEKKENESIQQMYDIINSLHQKNTIEKNPFSIQIEGIGELLIELLKRAEACEQERKENGKEQSQHLYYQNEVWEEGLLSCAQKIVEWFQFVSELLFDPNNLEKIIVSIKQIKSHCCQLVSAAHVSMCENSQNLLQLESITKEIRTIIDQFLFSLHEIHMNQSQQEKKENISSSKSDSIQSKLHLMESEVKVLQLQKELNEAQKQLYNLRKQEYN